MELWFSPNYYEKNDKIILTKKMKKLYCVICGKYWKFEKPKTSYLLEKTLVLSIICNKCNNEDELFLKKKNQLRYQKFLVWLKILNYSKNMVEKNVRQEIWRKNIDEKRNYLIE